MADFKKQSQDNNWNKENEGSSKSSESYTREAGSEEREENRGRKTEGRENEALSESGRNRQNS